jgi:hypothetical protein
MPRIKLQWTGNVEYSTEVDIDDNDAAAIRDEQGEYVLKRLEDEFQPDGTDVIWADYATIEEWKILDDDEE